MSQEGLDKATTIVESSALPLEDIKDSTIEMMELVQSQLHKMVKAVKEFDMDTVEQVMTSEKHVNALDLKIDKEIVKIMALHKPLAIDLRFILSGHKINTFLERIGDNAQGICKYLLKMEKAPSLEYVNKLRVFDGFNGVINMIDDVIQAYENEDTKIASQVLRFDRAIDEINDNSISVTVEALSQTTDQTEIQNILYFQSMVRKTERIGDLLENIAEEIIFSVDAKVLRHKKKKTQKYIDKKIDDAEA